MLSTCEFYPEGVGTGVERLLLVSSVKTVGM